MFLVRGQPAGRIVKPIGAALEHDPLEDMVFQSYAIWPHMTVAENVAYPLTIHRRPKDEVKRRVGDVLKIVGLDGLEDRPAPKLSGGQQQRVAFARALINEPKVMKALITMSPQMAAE